MAERESVKMAKSLYPEIAKMLGIELGEEFKITGSLIKDYIFRMTEDGLEQKKDNDEYWRTGDFSLHRLDHLLHGIASIIKIPFEPKEGDEYWRPLCNNTYGEETVEATSDTWVGTTLDLTLLALGMVYRTKEEAEAHLAEDYKKLTGKELEQ